MSKILIADDENIECRALELMLRKDFPDEELLPFATNGPELVERIEQEHPDVVVADINMPGLTGLDALELVKEHHPDMKIIICTAYSRFDFARKAMKLGASDYLVKPITHQDFRSAMGKVLGQLKQEREKQEKEASMERQLHQMNAMVSAFRQSQAAASGQMEPAEKSPAFSGLAAGQYETVAQVREALMLRLLKEGEQAGPGSRSEEYVMRALLYMEREYARDLSLDQTAENAGISTFYLSRLFKQELGESFVEILTRMRMARAVELLKENRYPVKEIASMTGYPNVTYFYKAFKKHTGLNVGELRRQWNLPGVDGQ